MNDEKKRRLREIIVEFEEDIKDDYWEFFIRKILGECGIAGLSTVKRLSRPAKNEIDGFLKDYKTDEYQNLYDKIGTTLISYNEDSLIDRFEVPDGVTIIGDKAFKGNETIQDFTLNVIDISDYSSIPESLKDEDGNVSFVTDKGFEGNIDRNGVTTVDGTVIVNGSIPLQPGYGPGLTADMYNAFTEMRAAAASDGLSIFPSTRTIRFDFR